mgnify:FL=1
MTYLENEQLSITINAKGAELQKITKKGTETETDYLWNANPAYWGKHSPILFPIVGTLKEDTYYYEGKAYHLSRHGFARDKTFEVTAAEKTSACFELKSNAATKEVYPFDFLLQVKYTLEGSKLTTRYKVANKGADAMYFSIGGHPAFNVPLEEGLKYSDYYLELDTAETAGRWPLQNGLLKIEPHPMLDNEWKIPLSYELFCNDAIVLKNLKSKTVTLKSDAGDRALTMNIEGFPYLGIWAAPDAPFVCIEPWCGITDSVDHNQELPCKEGIITLQAGEEWEKEWWATFV